MLRFDVNLSIIFTELPLLERPAAAAAAGFDAVELWWPFPDEPVPSSAELTALERALESAGTRLVGLNFDAGDMPSGDRGLLSLPDAAERFRANVPAAVELAARTGCQTMNALYGNRMPGVDPKIQDELAQRNLAIAAEAAAAVGATVVIETQNTADSPDYPLTRMADALRVVAAAQADNVAVLADLYHLYRMGEDLEAVITGYVDRLGHVQVADAPGRHQPGTGEIPFDRLLELLAAKGYEHWVGLEYKPLGASADSFEWLPQERRHAASTA